MRPIVLAATLVTLGSATDVVAAQERVEPFARAFSFIQDDPDRPRMGISTRSSGKRDTLGLLVESVMRESPAERAGIEEGDRLVSVNNVNLRLSASDAGEQDMEGITTRRLTRELAKLKAGDEVELRVYRDGQTRTVRVKTVAASELQTTERDRFTAVTSRLVDRAVLGLSLGGSGSARDTLGMLVVGVSREGPAAQAGIDEGDRLAQINGVDLRVPREDAGDHMASSSRVRRLNREMENVKAGDEVELRVYSNGQLKTVRAKAVKASELRDADGMHYFGDMLAPTLQRLRTIEPAVRRGLMVRPRINFETPRVEIRTVPRVKIQAEAEAAARSRAVEAIKRAVSVAGAYRL
jgi:S1-C subfamily serine protease